MSSASAARSSVYATTTTDGPGINGSSTARLGHRQGNASRTSLLPSDSISQAGGMAGPRTTSSKVIKSSIQSLKLILFLERSTSEDVK